ncbi:hypothetical protein GCM10022205_47190 [Spinactinospora alkalitolerans]
MLPRLAALVRVLMQLRLMLAALALLLMPGERISIPTAMAVIAFALLSGLIARYWERFVPYLLNHPLLITLDICCAAGILALDGPSGPFFATTVLTATVSGVLFGGRGVAGVAVFQILCYGTALLSYSTMTEGNGPVDVLTFQVLVVHPLLYPVAGYVGIRLRGIFTELAAEQSARREAERTAAASEERARLARDMHDSVAKTLRGAAMAAQALPVWLEKDPERAAATAAQVASAAETAAQEARELISDLRDDASDKSMSAAVTEVVTAWSAETGIPAGVHVPDHAVGLLVTARHETLAVLREALTNIERHAEATAVEVTMASESGHLVLCVSDDGKGFEVTPPPSSDAAKSRIGHYGLVGMRERAERAGGSLTVASAPGQGARISVKVPLVQAAPVAEEPTR